MTKQGGWALIEGGVEALEEFPTPEGLYAELGRRGREVDQRRKQALQALNDVQQFIAQALEIVEAGQWTSHYDLAALVGTSEGEVADFLAAAQVRIPNAYRVLQIDGSILDEGMLNAAFRGTDLRRRLAAEGLQFDEAGRAASYQRQTADVLMGLLDARRESEAETAVLARRAWMVRGTNVDGYNLVPDWLRLDFVSLSASQLADITEYPSYDALKDAVETAYQHKSYAYRGQRLEELDRFIRRMRMGDLLLTPMQGKVYLGEIASDPYFSDSDGELANLRREVNWYDDSAPIDVDQLRAPVPALLQSQAHVVDLTEAYDQLAALALGRQGDQGGGVRETGQDVRPTSLSAISGERTGKPRTLSFNPVDSATAADLLVDERELQKIADLLWERKQVIFYGPPGTGKTYLAKALARTLTTDGAVRLVQFHPSYTYEDFFEGFRPKSADGGTGALTFELTPGPFRLFAEAAKDNPTTAYILIIDEINRANLAKVFGELYFLLEYRDEAISLQYSPKEEFTLPENLFLIGTMNTADRSIARIDSAMRRRFAFMELDPGLPPVQGLLARWLERQKLPNEAALLLDLLNSRLADADVAIGPSYLMRRSVYELPDGTPRLDGLERVWQYEIMPLLADLFYGQVDLAERYGLPSLRTALDSPDPS
jgi:5-methylcytosine-specific restriction protein B